MTIFIDRLVNIVLLIFVFIVMFLGLYSIYNIYPVKYLADNNEYVIKDLIQDNYYNKNIVGYLKIYNTIIDYPILQGKNNTDYLALNYKNEYSNAGSIFLDYRNNRDFTDDFNIIYGHNMSYKAMFSELKNYKDKSYLKNHDEGKLFLKNTQYNIKIILYKEVNESDDIPYNLYLYRNNHNKKIYSYFMNQKGNKEKLLVLSTCKRGKKNRRVIILSILNKI